MSDRIRSISPIDGSVVADRPAATADELDAKLDRAVQALRHWRKLPLSERIERCTRMLDVLAARKGELARELTLQMGRPIRYAPSEIRGFEERSRVMLNLAGEALADHVPPEKKGFERFVRREPLGVVLVLAAWNYPYLIVANTLLPALVAGNVVLLKHADQTLLCAERLEEIAREAGIPGGVFQIAHMTHELAGKIVADSRVDHVAFTGSVAGGVAVHAAAGGKLKSVGLELGGKDPAYVREDANVSAAVASLVDGAYFNSGQSCCGVERIYVAQSRYEEFVEQFVHLTRSYVLGNPLDTETTLGPVVRKANADAIRDQIDDAIKRGAQPLIHASEFPDPGPAFVTPQVLVNVDHSMTIMREETFGPVVGIMPVISDSRAISLMNDSVYGLTASLWTQDVSIARTLADQLDTGTVFMNRCDYLDPELAWVGVKKSGRGCTLSRVGFEHLTRPKSFHFKLGEG